MLYSFNNAKSIKTLIKKNISFEIGKRDGKSNWGTLSQE